MSREPRSVEDHAFLGDTRTGALVGSDGSLDWMCVPRFDGPPVFARLIGGTTAGAFRMGPRGDAPVIQRGYKRDTATLETKWQTPTGQLVLTEGMVADVAGRLRPSTLLIRRLSAVGGASDVEIDFDPRLGEQRSAPRVRQDRRATVVEWATTALAITSTPSIGICPGRPSVVSVTPDRPLTTVLAVADREPLTYVDPGPAWRDLEGDEASWREWCADFDLADLPHPDAVIRSLLTLRLLTYSPSGAPVAAPTTSIPELVGGSRNWDYRFAWPRDASIGLAAFLGVGRDAEARRFLAWLLHASRLDRPRLPVLLTLHGRHPRPERELVEWPGYRESTPVRMGNGAWDQHQLDGYGWVIDAAWVLTRAGHPLNSETWRAMRGFADEVVRRWRDPDAGIWEIRGERAHHVHSKLMAWLALDRAIRIADTRSTPAAQTTRWRTERDAIASEVRERGFNPALGSYCRTYGSATLDAAVLVLPLLGMEPNDSPRIRGTIEAIRTGLSAGGPLLYRYEPGEDGIAGGEGAFLPCSFWLVQALAAIGRVDEAHHLFDELIALASPVGLFSEEMDPTSHAHLGNYPQALTHAALVQAALAIRDAARQTR